MFAQECFIKKNTKELRKKLRDLGYLDNTCFTFKDKFLYTLGGDYYTCKDYNKFSNMRSEEFVNECINCGTNEDLFLAIAALSNDTDYMQWFVCNEDHLTHQMNEYKRGDFQLCKDNKACINKVLPAWHKASVKELIEHFK